jgi:prepilin-type N-terminal cleavage/methylation domain-containing protein
MRNRGRPGFTLIELMVALALTMFIMVILSQAFTMSLETFSGMKGIGDMQINLRTAEVILRDDLRQDHFEGIRRLSDLTPTPGASQLMGPLPQAGFFAVRRSSNPTLSAASPYYIEGYDASNLPSFRATDHMLYMTVKRRGNRQENFFSASVNGPVSVLDQFFKAQTAYDVDGVLNLPYATQAAPYVTGSGSGIYNGQWAEVLYYLIRTGSTTEPHNPTSTLGTPIYALYRAQFVMVPDATNVNGVFANGQEMTTFAGISCNAGSTSVVFFSPADAAHQPPTGPVKRVIPDLHAFAPPATFDPANNRICAASTLVLPNVISFGIQVMPLLSATFVDVPPPVSGAAYGLYDTTKLSPTHATTGYTNGAANTGLKGIQITLRVWENNTRQTRQATIVQDL